MKNKLMKIILLIATLLIFFSNSEVYADGGYGPSVQNDERIYQDGLKDPTINPNSWKPDSAGQDAPELLEKAGEILGVINVIGVVASVIAKGTPRNFASD